MSATEKDTFKLSDEEKEKILKSRNKLKKKKKKDYSKFLVPFVIVINIAYALYVLYIFNKTGKEPIELTRSWFAFTTIELLGMVRIKTQKIKNGDSDTYVPYNENENMEV